MGARKKSRKPVDDNTIENRTVSRLESKYMRESKQNIYTVLEEEDFLWDEKDVELFEQMYINCMSLDEIADHFNRPVLEVLLLAIDRVKKESIIMRDKWNLY